MKQKIAKFMYGRYGSDEFSKALSVIAVLLLVISMFMGASGRSFMLVLVLALLIYTNYRIFSKNMTARRHENEKYMVLQNKVTDWWKLRRDMWKQRRDFKFFKCPSCKAVMRVPRGKGKIRIICKKCGTAFEKNT